MKRNSLILLTLFLLLASCSSRNLVYFSDIRPNASYSVATGESSDPRIQEDDQLSITVTSLNAESNMLFNAGVLTPAGTGNTVVSNPINENYLVDKNGYINYPVIGQIYLKGMTKLEAVNRMSELLTSYVQDPIVNIRFTNFKVTVIGEVQNPDSFVIPTERISILEALGLAGDMTPYGKRENVLIIREKDGVRTTTRINLNTNEILSSPYFYLQQNDIVYVEPYKTRAIQADTNPRTFAIISTASSFLIAIVFNLRFLLN